MKGAWPSSAVATHSEVSHSSESLPKGQRCHRGGLSGYVTFLEPRGRANHHMAAKASLAALPPHQVRGGAHRGGVDHKPSALFSSVF